MSAGADLLRLPQAELRALQDSRLRRMVELCHRLHPYYARLMRREGLEPHHIQTVDNLIRLPPTTKQDFLADPEAFRLDSAGLPGNEGTLWKVAYTAGTTTGRPAPIFITTHDHFAYMRCFARDQELIGLRATDLLANLFPLTGFPMGAYTRATDEAAAVGAAIIFTHTGRPAADLPMHRSLDEAVSAIALHRATVLYGVTGFVRRMLMRAQELGADFSALRLVLVTGEASSAAMRADMRARMRALQCADAQVVNRYGSTEQGGSMVECCEGSGFHSIVPDQLYHEVIEAGSARRVADGKTGLLSFSHLDRRGTVLLRYEVGDVASLTHATCPHCGRTSPRLSSPPMRRGDIVKVKGMLVNLRALDEALDHWSAIDEHQVMIRPQDPADPFSMDELVIRIAPGREAPPGIGAEVAAALTELVQVRPRVEIAARDAIYDPHLAAKPRRVLDLRNRQ